MSKQERRVRMSKDKIKIKEDFDYLAGVCEYCGLYNCGISPDPRGVKQQLTSRREK